MIRFEVFARTEVGCARERNEDSFGVLDLSSGVSGIWPAARVRAAEPPGTVVAVCDGMGGVAGGDLAAKMALAGLQEIMRNHAPIADVDQVEAAFLEAVHVANHRIATYATTHPEMQGMGTTLTAAALFGPQVVLVHVGDSRAYLRRGKALLQLTMDQNVVGQMVATGRIRPEDARNVKQRNMLLEAIGVQERVGPDLVRVRVQPGDDLLLCSDGLTEPLLDVQLLDIMLQHEDPVVCCRSLTEAACAAGGPDNVTVALVRLASDQVANAIAPIESERRPAVI